MYQYVFTVTIAYLFLFLCLIYDDKEKRSIVLLALVILVLKEIPHAPLFSLLGLLDTDTDLKISFFWFCFVAFTSLIILTANSILGHQEVDKQTLESVLVVEAVRRVLFITSALLLCAFLISSSIGDHSVRHVFLRERSGSGYIFALCNLSIAITLAVSLFKREVELRWVFLSMIQAYLVGSKGVFIYSAVIWVFAILTFPTEGQRIWRMPLVITIILVGVIGFLVNFGGLNNSDQVFLDRILEYLRQPVQFQRIVHEAVLHRQVELQHGALYLSSYWEYVPRAIYPEKPYFHGSASLLKYFHPDTDARIGTPGYGIFSYEYLDWGMFAGFASVIYRFTEIAIFVLAPVLTRQRPFLYLFTIAYFFVPFGSQYLPFLYALTIVGGVYGACSLALIPGRLRILN